MSIELLNSMTPQSGRMIKEDGSIVNIADGYQQTESGIIVSNVKLAGSRRVTKIILVGTPQNLTGAWADLGDEIKVNDYRKATLWLTLDINDSLNARVKMLVKHSEAGGEEYNVPIKTISQSDVKIEALYYELNDDLDQLIALTFELDNTYEYIQFQAMAGTPGASAGQFDKVYYTLAF